MKRKIKRKRERDGLMADFTFFFRLLTNVRAKKMRTKKKNKGVKARGVVALREINLKKFFLMARLN